MLLDEDRWARGGSRERPKTLADDVSGFDIFLGKDNDILQDTGRIACKQ